MPKTAQAERCVLTLVVRLAPQDPRTPEALFLWAQLPCVIPMVRVRASVPRFILWVRRYAAIEVRVVDGVGMCNELIAEHIFHDYPALFAEVRALRVVHILDRSVKLRVAVHAGRRLPCPPAAALGCR